jgi:hypothetical protein
MREFIGEPNTGGVYLAQCDEPFGTQPSLCPLEDLEQFLQQGVEISRSLWDASGIIAHLDIEYVNFDFPAEPYLDPLRIFALQQPVVLAIERLLVGWGIMPLHCLSGRGHHFVWRVGRRSQPFCRLAELGFQPAHLSEYYKRHPLQQGLVVDGQLGYAFAGLGLALEYVAHRICQLASEQVSIPLKITAVLVSAQQRGREMVSVDISEYGDPLNTRTIRVPFSVYRKPWRQQGVLHEAIAHRIEPMFLIPLHEMDLARGIYVMQDEQACIELAQVACVRIPDNPQGMMALLTEYQDSALARFHRYFYAQDHESASRWPHTYDMLDTASLPPCVRHALANPNDLLLKPAGIEMLTRTLLALHWHPRHIAGLLRSKYERDFGWGHRWYQYDAACRADFYTRLFSGLLLCGEDELSDFTCESMVARGLCVQPHHAGSGECCGVAQLRHDLLKRVEEYPYE